MKTLYARKDTITAAAPLIVHVLWLTGARVSEVLAIRGTDVDPLEDKVTLKTLKRRKEHYRVLPLSPAVASALRGFGDALVFPMSRVNAWRIVHASTGCSPRAIRHGHAIHALNARVPLNVIQAALGHANIATTSVYLNLTGKDIADGYAGVQW